MSERFPTRPRRLIPAPVGLNAEFYARAAMTRHLHIQRCDACGVWRHPPRLWCAACGGEAWSWSASSGRGSVFTWTVTHQVFDPAFAAEAPYAVVVVELDEGVRVVGNLLGAAPDVLALGLPVITELEVVGPDVALIHFRPVAA